MTFTPNINYSIYLRQCLLGEKRTDAHGCYACGSGTYSTYDYSNTSYTDTVSCVNCPDGALCMGYDYMGANVGYWKYDQYSNTIFTCYNGEACLGAYVEKGSSLGLDCKDLASNYVGFCFTGWCREGYTGIMCEGCADGWAQSDPVKKFCIKCTDNPGYYVKRLK